MQVGSIRRIVAAAAGAAVLALAMLVAPSATASTTAEQPRMRVAANAANFNPGYLISDYAMFNGSAMTEAEIQAFLDARIGTCQNGKCLNVLKVNTANKPADPMCKAYTGASNEPISRVIYKVQVACGVSAKAILVTLEKEQSLTTSKAPTQYALDRATGYGCPDTSGCDVNYFGPFNQIYRYAWAMVRYTMPPGTGPGTPWDTNYNWFKVGQTNAIRYHPNASCGTRSVVIQNKATASLYFYTPYTPNAAALANLYGMGDLCSSYGNRNFWRLYTDWFGSPTTLVPAGVETERLAGADRYLTAIEVSKNAYPDGAPVVYIATGQNYPDGLAAAPAAAQGGGPLLLTPTATLPPAVKAEIQRLAPQLIVVVGSEAVVSAGVYAQLAQLAPEIRRDAGPDRYATAIAIARNAFESAEQVFIATGGNFPDALSASAAGGHLDAPVLLARPDATSVPPELAQTIADLGATKIVIAGSAAVVSTPFEEALRALDGITEVIRLGGADRYGTSALINQYAFDEFTAAYIASGRDFPDALSGAAVAGALGRPLLLSNSVCVVTAELQRLVENDATWVGILGRPPVLRTTVDEFMTCG